MKIVTSERRESPEIVGRKLEMAPNRMFQQLTDKKKKIQAKPAEACTLKLRNVADLVYSNKLKQNHKHSLKSNIYARYRRKILSKNRQPQIWSDRYRNELNVWEN